MAKKRLKIKDKQGNVIDYDISAASVTIDVDGKSLDVKLTELVNAIASAVKSVTFNGNSPAVDASGNVNLGQQMQADWNEQNTNWPSYIRNKPTIPDGVECDAEMNATSEKPVQNKVIKAYIDAVSQRLNTLIGSGNVQGAIDTFNEVKAFLDGIDTDDQTLANQLLTLNNAITALQNTLSSKANSADVYSKSEVDTKVADAGKVKSVSVNGTKHTPDTNGDVDLGNLRGQDGNSGVASADGVESVNNLNGGTTDTTSRVYVLGANQGKRLRDQMELVYQRVQTLYGLLGNIAFWDGKPDASTILPALDWGNPKHTVTLALSLTNAVVKHNDSVVNDGASILVEEGGTLTFIVEPASGYTLTSVASSTTGATVTDLGNGTYSVAITMGQNNLTLSISATAMARHSINVSVNKVTQPMTFVAGKRNYSSENMAIAADTTTGVEVAGPTSVIHGASFAGTVMPSESHDLFSVAVSMGGTDITATAYNALTRVISISEVTADVLVSIVVAEAENGTFTGVSFMPQKIVGGINPTVGLLIGDAEWCCATDFFRIPNDATKMKWDFGVSKASEGDDSNFHRGLIMYDDGLTPTGYWSCYMAGTASGRTVTIRDTDKGKLVRASFYRSGLADAKVSISTDNGSTWSVVWNGMEHVVND